MNSNNFKIVVLIVLLVIMNISIEEITDLNVTGAEILLIRSFCNLIFAFILAGVSKQNIFPKKLKLQIVAFFCIGLSLLLVFTSYQYISAASVNTIQRLDIPLLTFLTLFSGKFSLKRFLLSLLTVSIIIALIFANKSTDENPIGYFLVIIAVIVTSIYTILQKRISIVENIASIMFVVSLSSVFWSSIRCLQTHTTFVNVSNFILASIIGLSIINFIIFYILNDLYKYHSSEFVRYPYLIAAFVIMLTEMIVEHKIFSPVLIIGNTTIIITLTILVRSRQNKSLINDTVNLPN